jgi:tetratricopeptide (TPR) repeat protein
MTGRQDLFDESMRLGHSAAWDLQWDRAIEFYRKALAEFPDNANALTSLGLALLETEQFKEALSIYHQAAKLSPSDPIPLEKCAEIFERLGQIEDAIAQRRSAAERYLSRKDAQKAIENWTHIARLKPDDLNTRSRLALTYERTGRIREAVHEYLSVASILQHAGKSHHAMEPLERALRIAPGNQEVNHAVRLLKQNKDLPPPTQPRGATAPLRMAKVQEYLKAESVDSSKKETDVADPEVVSQRQALTILAGLLFDEPKDDEEDRESQSSGMSELTRGVTGRLGKSAGQSITYRYLGQAIDLQTRGHSSQAVKEFQRALSSGLDHPAAHYNLGILYKELEEYDEARTHLLKSLGHPELDLGANLALGRLARMQNDLPEAARHLLQALRIADSLSVDESQSSALNQYYDTLAASQSNRDEEELDQIVSNTLNFLSGPDWLHRLREARQQLETQSPDTTKPVIDFFKFGGTDRVLVSLNRIDEYLTKELYTVAMEEIMMALTYAPTFLELHKRMADIMIKSGDMENGLAKLQKVAETHHVRGEFSQSTQIYEQILDVSPVNITARTRLIDLLAQQDRNEEALEQYLELAEIYRQMAEIDTARTALEDGLRLAQRSPVGREWSLKLLHQMGDIDLSRLDWRRALRVYEQVRTIDPSDEKARVNVIDLNLRLGQEEQAAQELDAYLEFLVQHSRGSEALTMLEEMARKYPGKQALHARLAEAYRAAGRTADAIAQYDALGEIQLDAGQTEEAITTIETIIELDPPDLEGYQELLHNLKTDQ